MENKIKKNTTILEYIINKIQHNPDHYIKFNIRDRKILACARCTGFTIGFFVGLTILLPFFLGFIFTDNFFLVFTVSWIFVIPSIVDWGSVKLGLRKGSNPLRFLVGYLQGIGYAMYLFILPIHIIFRVTTLALYESAFFTIRRLNARRLAKNRIKKKD